MKDRIYVLTTVYKAKIGKKNKVFVSHDYAQNRKEANKILAEKALTSDDMVGASLARIYRKDTKRETNMLKMAKNIVRGK